MKVADLLVLPSLAPISPKRFPRLVFRLAEQLDLLPMLPDSRRPDPTFAAALSPRVSADIRMVAAGGSVRLGLVFLDGTPVGSFLDRRDTDEKRLSVHLIPAQTRHVASAIAEAALAGSYSSGPETDVESQAWWGEDLVLTPHGLSISPVVATTNFLQIGGQHPRASFTIKRREDGSLLVMNGTISLGDLAPLSPDDRVEAVMAKIDELIALPQVLTEMTQTFSGQAMSRGDRKVKIEMRRTSDKPYHAVHSEKVPGGANVVSLGSDGAAIQGFRSACEAALRDLFIIS